MFGLQVFTVLSGSMEPTYHTGSVIYVKEVDYREITEGQVITFLLDEKTVATHRVVEVVPDEETPSVLRYRTKGDANEAIDGGLVHYKNVLGTPVFTIPYLGYLASFIQNPPGSYVAISLGALLLMLVFLPDLLFSEPATEEASAPAPKRKRRKSKKKPWYRRSPWYRSKQSERQAAPQPGARQPQAVRPQNPTQPQRVMQQPSHGQAVPQRRPAQQASPSPRPAPQRTPTQAPPTRRNTER